MKQFFPNSVIRLRVRYRAWVSLATHAALFSLSLLAAFLLRYDFRFESREEWVTTQFLPYLPVTLLVKILAFGLVGVYRDSWRYVGLRDLFSIIKAAHISFIACILLYYGYAWGANLYFPDAPFIHVPGSVFILDWFLTIGLVSAARIGFRFYNEELRPLENVTQTRLLIVGAGDAGDSILRDIIRSAEERYKVVGFLDDDESKQRSRIRGIDVLGRLEDIRRVCEQHGVDEVLIAMPSASQRTVRHLVALCQGTNLRFRTVPALTDLIEGRVQISQIRPVDIEDLLGREAVTLDTAAIGRYIAGKTVMVTGAGGSIGAEMCRQIVRFKPAKLLLVEQMENALFEIDRELGRGGLQQVARIPLVADITDADRIRRILAEEKPAAIFHAAAHKHVPMMELNPGEAIKNNVLGTRILADAAAEGGVEKFVMISTDKAVNPTSIMGCSKRVAEMYVQQLASHVNTRCEFVTVRFGNVLGSSGSVVPIFKDQIARGGPVTVTHPEMTRYFMTIPEAAQLVLQAGAMGHGGEVFLLDMGEPVKIVDLATDLITLSGLRPHEDIEIKFTGIRPGEKLFEELSILGEDVSRTDHPKIGIMNKRPEDYARVCECIERLRSLMDTASVVQIREELARTVPEYTPSVSEPTSVAASTSASRLASDAERADDELPAQARVRPA